MTNFVGNLDWSFFINAFMRLIPLLICVTLHELAHGYVANRLGDPTARILGRLTLNPIKHIDPVGALMILFVGFGWAKPVPVDMRNFRNPKRDMAITAVAGPLANIVLALFVLIILALIGNSLAGGNSNFPGEFFLHSIFSIAPGSISEFVYQIITRTAFLSLILAIFNLLPIPPLDGSKILFSFFSDRLHDAVMRYERFGFVILIALLLLPNFSGFPNVLSMIVFRPAMHLISSISLFLGIIPYEVYSFINQLEV